MNKLIKNKLIKSTTQKLTPLQVSHGDALLKLNFIQSLGVISEFEYEIPDVPDRWITVCLEHKFVKFGVERYEEESGEREDEDDFLRTTSTRKINKIVSDLIEKYQQEYN